MLSCTATPKDSVIFSTLPANASQDQLDKLELRAQAFFTLLEPSLEECKQQGLCRVTVKHTPELARDGETNEQSWNKALAERIGELARSCGFHPVVTARNELEFTPQPSSELLALKSPFLFTVAGHENPSKETYQLTLVDAAPRTDLRDAAIETHTQDAISTMRDLVTQLEQQRNTSTCIAAGKSILGLPETPYWALANIDYSPINEAVFTNMTEQLTKEWKERTDLAWQIRLSSVAVACFPEGTSGAQRMEMRAAGWEHFEQLPKQIDLERILYCA